MIQPDPIDWTASSAELVRAAQVAFNRASGADATGAPGAALRYAEAQVLATLATAAAVREQTDAMMLAGTARPSWMSP